MDYKKLISHKVAGYEKTEMHNLTGLRIPGNPDGDLPLIIHDDVFIFYVSRIGYFHIMQDVVSQFEFLKTRPGLKNLRMLAIVESQEEYDDIISSDPYILEVLRNYGFDGCGTDSNNVIRINSHQHIMVESAWFMSTSYSRLLERLLPNTFDVPMRGGNTKEFQEYIQYSVLGAQKAKESLLANYRNKSGARIYISSRKENEAIRRNLSGMIKSDGHLDMDKVKKQPWANDEIAAELQKKYYERYLSLYDENAIENYLIESGFNIINLADHSLEEQISIYSNAEIIIQFESGGVFNCGLVGPDAKVIIIGTTNAYDFWYRGILELANVNFVCVPERGNGAMLADSPLYKRYSSEDIIRSLRNHI